MGDVTITLDGNDITSTSLQGSWTRRLNRPATAQLRVPAVGSIGGAGSILKIEALIGTTTEIVFHGRVLLCETDMGEDTGYTTYNASDPMEMWQQRVVRDDDCDFSKPTTLEIYGPLGGPAVVENMLENTSGEGAGCCPGCDCEDTDAADCEGPLFLDLGAFETGCFDLSGAPVDWPMTIAEVTSLLTSTGACDIIITPTDPGGGIMGTVDGYCGDYGTDLSGSVQFEYGTGAHNVRQMRWNEDMTNMNNKLWYYMGPRVLSAADPAGDQHWCYNITGDDPGLPDPIPNGATLATLLADRQTSRTSNGVRMEVQIFDATSESCDPLANPLTAAFRQLYRSRWETESWIRLSPRELIHITPTRETEIGTFDIGDLVGVECVSTVRGGFSGAQRVYEYTISWDENGTLALSELQTSDTADQ